MSGEEEDTFEEDTFQEDTFEEDDGDTAARSPEASGDFEASATEGQSHSKSSTSREQTSASSPASTRQVDAAWTEGSAREGAADDQEKPSSGEGDPEASGEFDAESDPYSSPRGSSSTSDTESESHKDGDLVDTSGERSAADAPPAEVPAMGPTEGEEQSYGDDDYEEHSGDQTSAAASPSSTQKRGASETEEASASYGADEFEGSSSERVPAKAESDSGDSPKASPKASLQLPTAVLDRGQQPPEGDASSERSSERSSASSPAASQQAGEAGERPHVTFAPDAHGHGGRRPSVDSTPFHGMASFEGADVGVTPTMTGTTTATDGTSTPPDEEPDGEGSAVLAPPQSGSRRPSLVSFLPSFEGEPGVDRPSHRRPAGESTPHPRIAPGGSHFDLEEQDGEELVPPQTGSRRPSLVSFLPSFEGEPGVDRPSHRRPAGESTPHPGGSRSFDPEESSPLTSPSQQRKSVTFDPSASASGGDASEADGRPPSRRNSLRKSFYSTPFSQDVFGLGFDIEAETPSDSSEESAEAAGDRIAALEEETEIIVEDVADAPDAAGTVANAGVRPTSPGEEVFLLSSGTPQGPAGVALRPESSQRPTPLASSRSSSSPALLAQRRRARPKAGKKNPGAKFDRKAQSWDMRFHIVDETNDLKPKQLRQYFSRPASLPQLCEDLAKRGVPKARLEELQDKEVPPRRPEAPISADSGPPVIPGRHRIGGKMEQQGQPVPWNDRWHTGVHLYNEGMHPKHRAGFSRPSVFEESKSQLWRRQGHVEVAPGIWSPAKRYVSRFPPLGV